MPGSVPVKHCNSIREGDPVDPRGIPKDFFAVMDLSAFPPLARFLCHDPVRSGLSPATDIFPCTMTRSKP